MTKSVSFKVIAFTPDEFERLVYDASERQVHMYDTSMKERVSLTSGGVGFVLDPAKFPEGTWFLLVHKGEY